jgi:hypothetical protein
MNSLGQQSFEYRPLEKADSIRLLILKPGTPGSEIRGNLEETTIIDCRRDIYDHYTTLSYVWGDPTVTKTIFVDRQPFQVAVNLAAALEDLRDETRTLRMWADAICIDQSSFAERSVQVGLMRDIYCIAKQTVVYLGEFDAKSDAVLNEFQSSKMVSDECKHYLTAQVLSRPWFTRVWTYQELILSRVVWVQCGRTRILWETMCTAFPEIRDYHESPNEAVISNDNPVMLVSSMYHMREEFKRALLNGGGFPTLKDVLIARRGFKVSDLRDMVYGHLAVAGLHRPLSKNFGAISVDYTKSVSQVFTDAAAYIYTSSSCLNLLLGVELKDSLRRRRDLPSWVPDWSVDSSNGLELFRKRSDHKRWQHYLSTRSKLFYLDSPPVLATEVLEQGAVEMTSTVVIPSYDAIFKLECEVYGIAIAQLKESCRTLYTRAMARLSTHDDVDMTDKSVEETYKYVQQAMYSFWQERLGDILLDARMPGQLETPYEMKSRLDQYESTSTNPPEPFLEVFLKYLLRKQIFKGFQFCGRRLALVAKHDEWEGLEERLVAVPEATRPGDIIYHAIQEEISHLQIIVRPCKDEISTAEDIDISKKLRDKGCNFLGNDILRGRFVGLSLTLLDDNEFSQERMVKKQVVALH